MVLYRFRNLRFDRVRVGVRNATPETGYHRRCLLRFDGATLDYGWCSFVSGIAELLRASRDRPGRGLAGTVDALRLMAAEMKATVSSTDRR